MNKVEEIFKSWMISFDPTVEQANLASERIQICDECEFKVLTEIGPIFNIARCSLCGCSIKQKIFTPRTYLDGINEHNDPNLGSCPKSFWRGVEEEWLNNKSE